MAQEHLRQLVKHAIAREFSDEIDVEITDFQDQLLQFLRLYAKRAAKTSVEWLRVGYVQGNMNSDNCLISGRSNNFCILLLLLLLLVVPVETFVFIY